jgi:hypothetical protein
MASEISERLLKHGFVNKEGKADQEKSNAKMLDPTESDYPKAERRQKIIYETFGLSIEEPYYWFLNLIKEYVTRDIVKVKDVFSASETSAFFGSASARLNIQQDRASQYLGLIGKMLRDLFQIIREIKMIDMRVDMYTKSDKGDKSADMALKGIWVDLVEGGTKNASSVLGLSREVGFTILPDLFFGTYVKEAEHVDEAIKKLKFNEKIKEVLARKLSAFLIWKSHTKKEIDARRGFLIRYIRQHYDTIFMYMNWVRPYLTHVKRLSMEQGHLKSPDLIAAFEGSMIEIELMTRFVKKKKYSSCINFHFLYRTRPSMDFHQDGYQHRGPVHVGRVEINIRGYVWDNKTYENYLKYRRDEDFDLLSSIDDSIKEAMTLLGDDLKMYIEEAGGKWRHSQENSEEEDSSEEKKPSTSILDPFKDLVNGFGELTLGREIFGNGKKEVKTKVTKFQKWSESKEKEKLKSGMMDFPIWKICEFFKKAHRMLAW